MPLHKYSRFVWNSIRQQGLWFSLSEFASELLFDLTHGTHTLTPVEPNTAGTTGSVTDAVQYQGCSPAISRSLLATLPQEAFDAQFTDFGSGKGRTLILALEAGFPAITGVEFSSALVAAGRRNLERSGASNSKAAILHLDAAVYEPPHGPLVAFLYNPFHGRTLERVIANLVRHASKPGCPLWVLYLNPKGLRAFLNAGFAETARIERRGRTLGVQLTLPTATVERSQGKAGL